MDRVTRPDKARATPPQAEPPKSPGQHGNQGPARTDSGPAPRRNGSNGPARAGSGTAPGQNASNGPADTGHGPAPGQNGSNGPARAGSGPVPGFQPVPERDPGQAVQEASRRGALAKIAAHPRLPVWERRIAVALVAGIVFTLLFDWRIGLTVAVLAAIADTMQRAHSSALVPASRSAAQRRTERKLTRLDGAGYLSLHERAIPGSDNVIDHLVIGPAGVHAVDSERWDKRLPVRVIKRKQLWHGPFSQKDRLIEARWEAARASELISGALGRHVDVRPSLAIYGPKIPWQVLTIRDVDVYSGDEIRKYLRRRSKLNRGQRLSQADTQQIAAAAERVLPARY